MNPLVEIIADSPFPEDALNREPIDSDDLEGAMNNPSEMAVELAYRFDKPRFSNMKVPTILLLGGESPLFTAEAVKMVNSALPNSKIVILPGEQHIAHHTNPELFAHTILDFLKD
jgi:pimeloyl-ACP methyl ester carboxylesterase